MSVRVSGPYIDVKASQATPHAVTLYDPGRMSETHRFPAPEPAQAFADRQRELQSAE